MIFKRTVLFIMIFPVLIVIIFLLLTTSAELSDKLPKDSNEYLNTITGIIEELEIIKGADGKIYQVMKIQDDNNKYIANFVDGKALANDYEVVLKKLSKEEMFQDEFIEKLYLGSIHVSVEKIKPLGFFKGVPRKQNNE